MNIAKIQTKLPEFIKKKLTPVIYTQKAIVVNSEDDLKKGKEIVKEISGMSKAFKEYIAPVKKMFDLAHETVTTFEKENLAIGKKISDEQEKENSDWNKRVFESQQKKENYLKDFSNVISKMEQTIEQGKSNYTALLAKIDMQIELNRVAALPVPIAEKIDAIEEVKKEIESMPEPVIIPQVEKPIEKVALKKNLKKEVRSYFIKNEKVAIDRILYEYTEATKKGNLESANFWKGLLTITLSKSAINEALKLEEFKTFDFVSYTSEFK